VLRYTSPISMQTLFIVILHAWFDLWVARGRSTVFVLGHSFDKTSLKSKVSTWHLTLEQRSRYNGGERQRPGTLNARKLLPGPVVRASQVGLLSSRLAQDDVLTLSFFLI
jgi:hypothetical protein